jgi:protein-tyrosine kinase
MERLQAAIEKARAQRESQRTRARPAAEPASEPAPVVEAPPEAMFAVDAAWKALPELKLKQGLMQRNRILSLDGGDPAAPYDILRTRLIQQARGNGWRRIGVVSPHRACGKTTTVANLAFSMSRQRGIKTLVLDFDLRRSRIGAVLGHKCKAPMSEFLEGRVPFPEVALRYGMTLAFGCGQGATKAPSELLQSEQTRTLLAGLEETYAPDFMIFDLPPLNASDDSLGFLSQVDAALIIAEAEQTSLKQIDVAERQVAELTSVMGVVLNKCRYASGAYGYEDGYY